MAASSIHRIGNRDEELAPMVRSCIQGLAAGRRSHPQKKGCGCPQPFLVTADRPGQNR